MSTEYQHTPVMIEEVINYLNPRKGQFFIDCTLGGGGYTFALAKQVGKTGQVLAIDLDENAIKNAKLKKINYHRLGHRICEANGIPPSQNKYKWRDKLGNVILINENFKNLQKIVSDFAAKNPSLEVLPTGNSKKTINFDGIVFDLGLSSAQLQDRSRGFSFKLDAPLNMDFAGKGVNNDTEYIVNHWRQSDLEKIFREYGEERLAEKIAKKITEYRKTKRIKTTGQLVEIILEAIPKKCQNFKRKIHPATKIFQALRIATNNELENLKIALAAAIKLLKPSGKIMVISYHSLEDRIVKRFFRQESKDCICPPELPVCRCGHKAQLKIINKKVIIPTDNEIKSNPRARSAKMRIAEKI